MPQQELMEEFRGELAGREPGGSIALASAFGRIDVLGSMGADSGGAALQMLLPTEVAVAIVPDRNIPAGHFRIQSNNILPPMGVSTVTVPCQNARSGALSELRSALAGGGEWATGIVTLLHLADQESSVIAALDGHLIQIRSRLPMACGQASSTAILAAALRALAIRVQQTFTLEQSINWIARADAQTLTDAPENTLGLASVHRGCGMTRHLDATTILRGTPGKLIHYSTQPPHPDSLLPQLVEEQPLPIDVRLLALNTGVRVANVEQTQSEIRIAAMMGYQVIETIYKDLGQARTPLRGYLANTSPLLYRQYFRTLLPRRLRGQDFLRTYNPTTHSKEACNEPAWETFNPAAMYRVRTAVDHLISENEYAEQFLQAMDELNDSAGPLNHDRQERYKTMQRAGRLLLASHHSYRLRLELSCREADWLVDRLMIAGPENGVFGARITGSGGGGTVIALLDRSSAANDVLLEIMQSYSSTTGLHLGITDASTHRG